MSDGRLLLQLLMLDAGIVPDIKLSESYCGDPSSPWEFWSVKKPDNLDVMLESLSENDKKKVKRKFRKLWKKAAKKYRTDLSSSSKDFTSPSLKARRRASVKRMLQDSYYLGRNNKKE